MDGNGFEHARMVSCNRELEGWRAICQLHPQAYPRLDFQIHLAPAFRYGLHARRVWRDATWNDDLDDELALEWDQHRNGSILPWVRARALVRHGFEGFRGPRPAPVQVRRAAPRHVAERGWLAWLTRWFAQGGRLGAPG